VSGDDDPPRARATPCAAGGASDEEVGMGEKSPESDEGGIGED
jgi:hypothetical protein